MGHPIFRKTATGFTRVKNIRYKSTSFIKAHFIALINTIYTTLDGIDDYGIIPDNPFLQGIENVSIECDFVLGSNADLESDMYLISKGSDTLSLSGWGIQLVISSGRLRAACTVATSPDITTTLDSTFLLSKSTWYNVKATFVKGDKLYLYINGELNNSMSISDDFMRHHNNSIIGRRPTNISIDSLFDGNIKNIKIYNDSILVAHYPMNDEQVSSVFKDIINGNDAIKYGSPIAHAGDENGLVRVLI